MSKLWKWIDNRDLSNEGKIRAFLLLNFLLYGAMGLFVWLIVSSFMEITTDWAICLVAYPAVFIAAGFLLSFISKKEKKSCRIRFSCMCYLCYITIKMSKVNEHEKQNIRY